MEENTQLPKDDNNIPLTVEIVDLVIDMLSADASRARMEKEILKLLNKAAYATKLHQANETIKDLTYDNNRLKGEVEGLTSALDELRTKYDNILATESGHESKTENVWQSGYAAGHEVGYERGKREAQPGVRWVKADNRDLDGTAGREDANRCPVYVPCTEDDPDCCGGYTSNDGRSLCYVKEVLVPLSAFKQKEK